MEIINRELSKIFGIATVTTMIIFVAISPVSEPSRHIRTDMIRIKCDQNIDKSYVISDYGYGDDELDQEQSYDCGWESYACR